MKYPNMRLELLNYLQDLASRACLLPEGKAAGRLDAAVHFLYDDTPLSEDPQALVGIMLRDEREVVAVQRVVRSLDDLFEAHGLERSDEEYSQTSEWRPVEEAAKAALVVLSS